MPFVEKTWLGRNVYEVVKFFGFFKFLSLFQYSE